MPKEELYAPPLNIKVRDNRQFGRKPLVGVFVVKSLELFRCSPLPMDAEEDEITSIPNGSFPLSISYNNADDIIVISGVLSGFSRISPVLKNHYHSYNRLYSNFCLLNLLQLLYI